MGFIFKLSLSCKHKALINTQSYRCSIDMWITQILNTAFTMVTHGNIKNVFDSMEMDCVQCDCDSK